MKTSSASAQQIPRQMGRFLIVGLVVAAIDLAVFLVAIWLGVPRVYANVIGMTAGFCAGLIGHHHFTFDSGQRLSWAIAARYALGFGFNLLLGSITLEVLVYLDASVLVAKLVAMGAVVASNFIVSRQFVFRRRKNLSPSNSGGP
jgi:putative flippase GtrA